MKRVLEFSFWFFIQRSSNDSLLVPNLGRLREEAPALLEEAGEVGSLVATVVESQGAAAPAVYDRFKAIVSGEYDHLPEQAFYMVGSIEEAVAKAKTLS